MNLLKNTLFWPLRDHMQARARRHRHGYHVTHVQDGTALIISRLWVKTAQTLLLILSMRSSSFSVRGHGVLLNYDFGFLLPGSFTKHGQKSAPPIAMTPSFRFFRSFLKQTDTSCNCQ